MRMNSPDLTRRESAVVWAGSAVWLAGLGAALVVTLGAERPRQWLAVTVAALAVGGLAAVALVVVRSALRREGVERTAGIEAAAMAFGATMAGAFTYGIVDAFADVPALRAPWVLMFGLITWSVAHAARLTRYR